MGLRASSLASFLMALCLSSAASLLGLFFCANLIVYCGGAGRMRADLEAVKPCEVAIVLGAGPGSPTLDARLDAGIALWRAGKVRRILITGGTDGTGYGETEYMWRYLLHAGVSPHLIVVDPFGLRTLDSVWRARRVFGFRDVVVVTQRYHAYRGVFLARCNRLDAQGYAAAPVASPEFAHSVRREWLARVVAVWDILRHRRPTHGDQPPQLANHPAH